MAMGMPGVPQFEPGGDMNVPGQNSDTSKLNDFLGILRQCKGAPYQFWNDGGDGKHNNSIADVKANGESCSGIFVFAFRKIGMDPPFAGTYDLKNKLASSGDKFDPSKDYPVGTFVVGLEPGTEGHMFMISGSNNTVFESSINDGVNEGKSAEDVATGSYNMTGTIYAGGMDNLGTTANSSGNLGESWMAGLFEQIASGIAKGLIRFIRAVYCIAILWPIDFISGFWWELTKQLAGFWGGVMEDIDILGTLKGENPPTPDFPPIKDSDLFSEENQNRFFWLLFIVLGYVLAFGRDKQNNSHLDNLFSAGERAGIGGASAKKGYNEEAVTGAVVSRHAGQPIPGSKQDKRSGPRRRFEDSTITDIGKDTGGSRKVAKTRRVQETDPATKKFVKSRKDGEKE